MAFLGGVVEDNSLFSGTSNETIQQVIEHLLDSEKCYSEQLSRLSDIYISPLKQYVVSGDELEKLLLGKIKDIIDLSGRLSGKVSERLDSWDDSTSKIADLFLNDAAFWDLYKYYSNNIQTALGKLDEKMNNPDMADFAALVALKQGMTNPSLDELILLPMQRLIEYKKIFRAFLEISVNRNFTFSHPDFSNVMNTIKMIEDIAPESVDLLLYQNKSEDYRKIESLLGDRAPYFSAHIRAVHQESTGVVKSWKKKTTSRKTQQRQPKVDTTVERPPPEKVDLGGKSYSESTVAPDILNAIENHEHIQAMTGVNANKVKKSENSKPPAYYLVRTGDKVKVKWENEDQSHTYILHLFKQCVFFSKIKKHRMEMYEEINLKTMWVSEYSAASDSSIGTVENPDNVFVAGWFEQVSTADEYELIKRVIFSFNNSDTRNFWFLLLQRHIKECKERIGNPTGRIEVRYKSDVPGGKAGVGGGMSQYTLDIDINNDVGTVTNRVVKECRLKEGSYRLMFIILQGKEVIYHIQLIDKEFPLILQNEAKVVCKDMKNLQILFVLQHQISKDVPQTRQRHNTLTFFRARLGARTTRPSTITELPVQGFLQEPTIGTMFGVPLSQFMSKSKEIPASLMDIMKYLHNHCHTHKGIFREPGLKRMEKIIKSKLDQGETFDWASEQTNYCLPNVAASLLKSYFRSLPEGLFLKSLFPDFERWRESEIDQRLGNMKVILSEMPEANLTVAKSLLYVLLKIAEHSEVNLMSTSNIAVCIGNSIIMWPDDADSLVILADSERQRTPNLVVEYLLKNVKELFGDKPVSLTKPTDEAESDVVSRRSKISELEDVSSEDEERGNIWLRSLLRTAVDENSPSSSMFVEIGSPTFSSQEGKKVSVVAGGDNENACHRKISQASPTATSPQTPKALESPAGGWFKDDVKPARNIPSKIIVMESLQTQTIHSTPLRNNPSLSVYPEQCEPELSPGAPPGSGREDSGSEKEHKNFFTFATKKVKNKGSFKNKAEKSSDGGEKKRGSSIKRSKKKSTKEKEAIVEKLKSKSETSITLNANEIKNTEFSSEDEAGKKVFDRNDPVRRHYSGSRPTVKQTETTAVAETSSKPPAKGQKYAAARTDSDNIQQAKESTGSARILVTRNSSLNRRQEAKKMVEQGPTPVTQTVVTVKYGPVITTTPCPTNPKPPISGDVASPKKGYELVQLVSNLEKLTNPQLTRAKRHFSGSVESGTESASSCDDEQLLNMGQESYV